MVGTVPEELVVAALQSLDALLESQSLRYNRDYSLGTGDLGYVLAADLAWRLTGDQRYRLTAARILARAWEVGVRGTSVGLHTGRAGLALK